MPLLNSLATPYADALLQVGDGLGQADQLALEAKSLLEAWYSSADLQGAMRSPVLSLDGKKNALVALFGSEISPSMLNLLKVLVDRQRIGILDAVLGRFLELYRELRGITLATVTSATALSTEQQQKLTEKVKALKVLVDRQRIGILDSVLGRFLELYRELRGITLATVTSATALSTEQQQKLTEKVKALAGTNSVEVDINVDATLIGGFVVRLGSQVIDASLLGQVKRLGLSLARAA